MKVSICILAKDEASRIGETLERLFDQELLCMPTPQIEKIDVSCVANGCTDNTASIAEVVFASRRNSHPNKTFTVHELEMPGKSNAWNYYVHQVSASDTDFYVFMDADVIFPKTDALTKLLNTLIDAPEAFVSVGLPLKDISRKSRQSLFDKSSLAISELTRKGTPAISGLLYCARGSHLQKIWMPRGLPVEDGFLAAMTFTNGFTEPDVRGRIVRADVPFFFEAHKKLFRLLRHQKRIIVGTAINAIIYRYLWSLNSTSDKVVGAEIHRLNDTEPEWVARMIRERANESWWVVPNSLIMARFRSLRRFKFVERLMRLPVVLAATFVELPVMLSANLTIRRGQGIGYW